MLPKSIANMDCQPSCGSPCLKGTASSFCLMVKKAVKDLNPCGLSTKRGISKYIEMRYGIKDSCLLSCSLKWLICSGVLRRECGLYSFCGSSKAIDDSIACASDCKPNCCDPCCKPISCNPCIPKSFLSCCKPKCKKKCCKAKCCKPLCKQKCCEPCCKPKSCKQCCKTKCTTRRCKLKCCQPYKSKCRKPCCKPNCCTPKCKPKKKCRSRCYYKCGPSC